MITSSPQICIALKYESYQLYPSTVLKTELESNRDAFGRVVPINIDENTVVKINVRQVFGEKVFKCCILIVDVSSHCNVKTCNIENFKLSCVFNM
jgi:hypothetical protein